MNTSQQPAARPDLTLRSRYECKYLIDPEQASGIRQFLSAFAEPDPYAARRPDLRYPICSLYLDSPDLALFQQTVGGDKNRFKLRVRTYSDDPAVPLFFEVKRRFNGIVSKQRAAVDRETAARLLADERALDVENAPDAVRHELQAFLQRRSLTDARPVVKVKYMREAYQSRGGDPVRVTLDDELCHAVALDGNLGLDAGRWVRTPVSGTILELKYTELCPDWIRDLVRTFGLRQQPVPKYVMCLEDLMGRGRASAISLAGFVLPPRGYATWI